MKSSRNKTIDISVGEGQEYLSRCISLDTPPELSDILDRTILGDCLETMPMLPRAFADLVIADPPYNMNKTFSSSSFVQLSGNDYKRYTEEWISRVRPLMKESASIYVCCDWRCSSIIASVLEEHFIVRNRITWQREKGRGAAKNWKNSMEDIWFATVSEDYTFNLDAVKIRKRVIAPYRNNGVPKDWEENDSGRWRSTCPSNFWSDITVPYWSMPENTAHPTQKPEKLLAKLILASSNPGDVVFDPFLGSGSSSVTAKKLGRHYSGIEREAEFCVWAEKRLEMADDDSRIQGYTDGFFKERNEK